jgi:aminomethyltransferase
MEADIKKTPLYDKHVALGAKMVEFAGYMMPVWYPAGQIKEHLAVRNSVGIFDLTHMGEFFIKGARAFEFVQHITCNDVRKIGNGGVQYTLFPTPEGGVVDDLLVYQLNPEYFMMVVNASNIDKDWAWVNKQNSFGVELTNSSDEYALIAVQGPRTEEVLTRAGFANVAYDHPFTFRRVKRGKEQLFLCVTGYTGERGFEIIMKNAAAPQLWDDLMSAGKDIGVMPIGLGARDTLRLEAGLCLYGHELEKDTSVMEANLAWAVGFGKDFLGKDVLVRHRDEGTKRLLFGITVEKQHGCPRPGAKVYDGGSEAGVVTSGAPSPSLDGKGIAFSYLRTDLCEIGRELEVEVRGKRVPAAVVKPPFVKHHLFDH